MDELHAAGKHYSDARLEIGVIKFWGAKVLYNVIDRAIQVHGSLGYTTDLPLESMYRHARAARIYDGPDEVHKVTVARQLLKNYRSPRGAQRARPDPSRRGDREVRRPARRHLHQRLLTAQERRGPTAARLSAYASRCSAPWVHSVSDATRCRPHPSVSGVRVLGAGGPRTKHSDAAKHSDGSGSCGQPGGCTCRRPRRRRGTRRGGDGLEVLAGEGGGQLGLLVQRVEREAVPCGWPRRRARAAVADVAEVVVALHRAGDRRPLGVRRPPAGCRRRPSGRSRRRRRRSQEGQLDGAGRRCGPRDRRRRCRRRRT